MLNIKYITLGAILAALAALIQLTPFFFSEMFVLLTVFSALPIYTISRLNPKVGTPSYFITGFIVMLFSVHEGLLFFFTNGIIGVALGISSYYMKRKHFILIISSIVLTIALSIINFGIGIPVFGGKIPGIIEVQLAILLCFSIVYNVIYFYFANFIFNRLKKSGLINNFIS